MSNFLKRLCSIRMILLIVLIILFYSELFALGVRLYVTMTDSPSAERFLGDYYKSAAEQNLAYSNKFYQSSLGKYKDKLTSASDDKKAKIDMKIAEYYECGKGLPADLPQAKQYYEEASKMAGSDQATKSSADESATKINQAIQNKTPASCPNQTGFQFLKKTFEDYKKES